MIRLISSISLNLNLSIYQFINEKVRGLTDNNALNYRTENDKERSDAPEKSNSVKAHFDRDSERDIDVDSDRERDNRDRRNEDKISLHDYKDLKERDRENTLTHAEISNKRRRKNSSNCDNSLISTFNANVQERHYSQDSQVMNNLYIILILNVIIVDQKIIYHILTITMTTCTVCE